MSESTQAWLALAVVALTAGLFLWRALRKRMKSSAGCGHDCGCATKKPLQKP
jgi:hypothetical protein